VTLYLITDASARVIPTIVMVIIPPMLVQRLMGGRNSLASIEGRDSEFVLEEIIIEINHEGAKRTKKEEKEEKEEEEI
jgi:hypothetical protein